MSPLHPLRYVRPGLLRRGCRVKICGVHGVLRYANLLEVGNNIFKMAENAYDSTSHGQVVVIDTWPETTAQALPKQQLSLLIILGTRFQKTLYIFDAIQ